MNAESCWQILFAILLLAYLLIQFSVKNKVRYYAYFIGGMLFGFCFDIISFVQGYYSYPAFYNYTILGIPLSMTFAEGFSVVITIYIVTFLKKCYDTKSFRLKNLS